ncbi:MAG: YciI family protein [Anaerolineae bacterium]|nr:YciI family protein [Anaerolineae bacterium]MDQ7034691.1 YciI family protein [Anaerolineae bacterium]
MTNYALTYYAEPNLATQAHGDQTKFRTWLGRLGDAVVNPGMPLGMPKIVSADGVSDNDGSKRRSTGFSIVTADNMDAALEMVKDCPFLEMGTVEVAEVFEM